MSTYFNIWRFYLSILTKLVGAVAVMKFEIQLNFFIYLLAYFVRFVIHQILYKISINNQ